MVVIVDSWLERKSISVWRRSYVGTRAARRRDLPRNTPPQPSTLRDFLIENFTVVELADLRSIFDDCGDVRMPPCTSTDDLMRARQAIRKLFHFDLWAAFGTELRQIADQRIAGVICYADSHPDKGRSAAAADLACWRAVLRELQDGAALAECEAFNINKAVAPATKAALVARKQHRI